MSPDETTSHLLSAMAEGRAFLCQEHQREIERKDAEIAVLRAELARLAPPVPKETPP